MATYTAPTTRTTGALISASIWNTDIVENLKYFKDAPVFDGDISVGDDIFLTSTGAVINFASGDVTITHSTNTLTFAGAASGYIFNDGNVGIGVTPGSVKLDILGATAIRTASVDTNATTKEGKYVFRHYTNAEEDVMFAYVYSTSTANEIYIGGGASSQNAATQISFSTAANNTTVAGTERLRILSGGNIGIGATARLYLDGVAGTGDTYLHEQASNRPSLVVAGVERFAVTAAGVESYGSEGLGYYASGTGTSTGTAVVHATNGYLYRQSSSRRFKENISTAAVADAQLDAFMATAPSWWDYKGQKNGALGFIAEDLAALPMERYGFNPLVNYDGDGQIESNRDYALIAMHHLVIQRLERKIAVLEARIH